MVSKVNSSQLIYRRFQELKEMHYAQGHAETHWNSQLTMINSILPQQLPSKRWSKRRLWHKPGAISQTTIDAWEGERAVLSSQKLNKWFRDPHNYLQEDRHFNPTYPKRIWNGDESGFPLGPTSEKTLGVKNQRFGYQFGANTKQNMTTIVAGSASGVFIPPTCMIVYPGIRKPQSWMPLEGAPTR